MNADIIQRNSNGPLVLDQTLSEEVTFNVTLDEGTATRPDFRGRCIDIYFIV